MDEIVVRKATKDDLPVLRRFQAGVVDSERPFDSTLKSGELQYYHIEEMISAPHIELLVAEADDRVIGSGFARIEISKDYLKHERHSHLGFMYVLPEYRGRGVNKLIVERLKQWSRSQNITEIRLEVYFENSPAISAYQKAGFSKLIVEMRMEIEDD